MMWPSTGLSRGLHAGECGRSTDHELNVAGQRLGEPYAGSGTWNSHGAFQGRLLALVGPNTARQVNPSGIK